MNRFWNMIAQSVLIFLKSYWNNINYCVIALSEANSMLNVSTTTADFYNIALILILLLLLLYLDMDVVFDLAWYERTLGTLNINCVNIVFDGMHSNDHQLHNTRSSGTTTPLQNNNLPISRTSTRTSNKSITSKINNSNNDNNNNSIISTSAGTGKSDE